MIYINHVTNRGLKNDKQGMANNEITIRINILDVFRFLAATKQLYKWYCPSVRLSVCHTFLTMSPSPYHHEIFRSYYQ